MCCAKLVKLSPPDTNSWAKPLRLPMAVPIPFAANLIRPAPAMFKYLVFCCTALVLSLTASLCLVETLTPDCRALLYACCVLAACDLGSDPEVLAIFSIAATSLTSVTSLATPFSPPIFSILISSAIYSQIQLCTYINNNGIYIYNSI